MEYLTFFIQFNLYLLLPILIFGIIFHILSIKSSYNLMQVGWITYVLFAWIGTPIHELSHYLMCLIFRFKVIEVKLFRPFRGKKDGILGYVNYSYNPKSLYQKIGNFFVGIAPMIGGSFFIYGLFRLLMNPLYVNLREMKNIDYLTIKEVILTTNYNIPLLILFIVLTIGISMHMSISKEDLKNAIYGIIWLELILLLSSIILTIFNINLIEYLKIISIMLLVILGIGLFFNIIALFITSIIKN